MASAANTQRCLYLSVFSSFLSLRLQRTPGTFDDKSNYKDKITCYLHDIYMYLIFSAALLIKKPTTKLKWYLFESEL